MKSRRSGIIIQVITGVMIVTIGALLVLGFWPSTSVTFDDEWEVTSIEDRTVTFNASFCNEGVNTETQRFMDLYLEIDGELKRGGAFDLPGVRSFSADIGRSGCFENVPQPVIVPDYVEPGQYRFRIITKWSFAGFDRQTEVESELFTLGE